VSADDPLAANRLLDRIADAVAQPADFPTMGRPGRNSATRELVIAKTPYIVPYRVRAGVLEILRIHHGARLWPKPPTRRERS